jgi:hypothetical protein
MENPNPNTTPGSRPEPRPDRMPQGDPTDPRRTREKDDDRDEGGKNPQTPKTA